jgi:folate-binding protein YgfZ
VNSAAGRLRILRSAGGFFPLTGKSTIFLTGADCERFLNGQLTVDVRSLQSGHARPALLLTPKGKMCAALWLWKEGDSFVIEVDADQVEITKSRLERYIVSDDVTISEPVSPRIFHAFGSDEASGIRKINRLGNGGCDCLEPPAGLLEAGSEELEILRIERGIPRWGFELTADSLPQEARLESTAVDFHKGCYVGQEVVSRLKSVGHVNRRLFAFVATLAPQEKAPLPIHLQGTPDVPAGLITSMCHDFELAQTLALGYLNRQFEDSNAFVAAGADGKILGKFEKRPILI